MASDKFKSIQEEFNIKDIFTYQDCKDEVSSLESLPKTKVDNKIEPKSDGESDDLSRPPKLHKVEYDSNWSYPSGGAWTQDPWDTQSCRERREKDLMKRAVRHLSFKS